MSPRAHTGLVSRRTKIIATIGPASDSKAQLTALVEAGMDVARLGLAHGTLDEALDRYHRLRQVEASVGRPLGVLVDLPGPKVRAGTMPDEGLTLEDGADVRLMPGDGESRPGVVHVEHDGLLTDLQLGDRVAFGDGSVVAELVERDADGFGARLLHGGVLHGRPGVHIPSDRLRLPTPTQEDLRLLDAFVEQGVDMVALSFVRSAHDVRRVGTEPHPRGPLVVAKVETRSAVDNLEGIIEASGAVMVARGDLGAEFPIEELPHLQKRILELCITLGRPAITATQMLESMVHAPSPTRAEASDIANAVFDGSSALMLSAETAIGEDPINAVATMARIAARADVAFDYDGWPSRLRKVHGARDTGIDEVVTNGMTDAAWRAARETGATAIICVTRTGFTVRSIARFRPQAKILGFSTDPRTRRQLTLSWGATPYDLSGDYDADSQVRSAVALAREHGEVQDGDLVVVLSGSPELQGRATDSLRLVRIG